MNNNVTINDILVVPSQAQKPVYSFQHYAI